MSATADRPVPATSRGGALRIAAAAFALLAVALPQAWLVGEPVPGDPRDLVLGSWLLRGALLVLAAFLALAPRFERGATVPAEVSPLSRAATRAAWAIVVVAAALRAWRLDAPLWFDEIWMILDSVRPPVPETLRSFTSDNNHPLYTFLATVCTRAFGETAWALRLPAAAFGAASVGAAYLFARRRLGERTALVAAAILAVFSHHVSYSQNARAYTGLLLFTLLGSHFLLVALETGTRRAWIAHGVSLAVCVMLHLTGVFTAVGHLAVIAWYAWRKPAPLAAGGLRAASLGFVLATLTAFAAYALVLPQVVHFFLLREDRVAVDAAWTNPLWLVTETAERLGMGLGLVPGLVLLAIGGAVATAGLVAAGRRSPALALLSVVPAAAVAVVMLGLGRNLWPRLFFFGAGFGVLVAVEGAVVAVRHVGGRFLSLGPDVLRRLETLTLAALVLACAATLPRAYAPPKQDFDAALRWVRAALRPGESAVSVGMASFVYREYHRAGLADVTTAAEMDAAIPSGRAGYVLYTFPVYVESRLPEVWSVLREEGREVARFPASIGGGDLVVVRIER